MTQQKNTLLKLHQNKTKKGAKLKSIIQKGSTQEGKCGEKRQNQGQHVE